MLLTNLCCLGLGCWCPFCMLKDAWLCFFHIWDSQCTSTQWQCYISSLLLLRVILNLSGLSFCYSISSKHYWDIISLLGFLVELKLTNKSYIVWNGKQEHSFLAWHQFRKFVQISFLHLHWHSQADPKWVCTCCSSHSVMQSRIWVSGTCDSSEHCTGQLLFNFCFTNNHKACHRRF